MKNPVSSKSSKQVVNPVLISNTDIYKKVGNEVVLSPGPVTDLNSIVWRHGSKIAVEWSGGDIDYFTDRCTLNTTTGELTISGLTLEDSSSYTAEINDRVLYTTKILVISEVPTPTVSESCDAEKTHCVLTCEGITTDSEPVVYSWWSGGVMKSDTKELNITKEEKDPSFFCKMENPVSFESSKEVLNPFINPPDPVNNNLYWLFILPVVGVIVGVIVGVFIYKRRRENLPSIPLYSSFKTNAEAADSSQTSPNPVPEMKPLINGDKDVVQESFNLETINETDVQVTSPQDQTMDVSTGNINGTMTTLEKPEHTEAAAEPPPSAPSSDVQVTSPQDQTMGVSTGNIKEPETTSVKPEDTEAPAESPTPSSSETTSEKPEDTEAADPPQSAPSSGVQLTSSQELRTDVSTGTNNEPDTTSEKPEHTEAAAEPPPSGPSSDTSDQSEGEEQPLKDVSQEANNEPETTPETPANQGPPAKPQRSSSSLDNVTPPQDQKTHESTKNNDGPENSSETPVVVKSPPDLKKTTVAPNSEALNPNMEEKQANED